MLFGWFYFDWTMLIVIPAAVFAMIAQMKVNSTFEEYNKDLTYSGLTAAQAARKLLDANGLFDVGIERVAGNLTDHYHPKHKKLFLSESVYDSKSVAAIGVACHEAGHALQDARNYAFLKLRMSIIPVCNFGSGLAMPLFLIGLIVSYNFGSIGYALMLAGIAFFSLATLFQLVTLPVEFNASKRALEGMGDCGILKNDELPKARKVLDAAAMTYVAALAVSLMSLLRLLVIANSRKR